MRLQRKFPFITLGRKGVKLTDATFWTRAYYGYDIENSTTYQITKGYGGNPYVYMVVSRIAQTVARLPVYIMDGDKEVTSGDLLKIWTNPNRHSLKQTSQQFIEDVITNLLMGECFILNEQAVGYEDKLIAHRALKNKFVEILIDNNEEIKGYRYTEAGKVLEYEKERVTHIKLPNVVYNNGEKAHHGLSPLEILKNVYTASNNITEAEASIFKNRGITGILTNDSDIPLLPQDEEKIQSEWNERTSGAAKFGMIKVTNSKLRYLELGMSPKDLQLTGTNIDKLRTICSVYNVDSSLFNDPANKTYSNRSEAQKAFYVDCVLPWAEFTLGKLNQYFADKLKTTHRLVIDTDRIEALKEINRELTDNVIAQINANLLSIPEAQSILGLNVTEQREVQVLLNGAQVTSLITLLQSAVGENAIPSAVISPVIHAAFPTIPLEIVEEIINGFQKGK